MSLPSGTQSTWASGTQQVITNVSRRLTKDSIVIANDRTTTASTPPTISTYQATYYLSGNQILTGPGGTGATDITFDTNASWNNDGGYITHTSGSKDFVVTQPGLYQLEWNASILANGSTWTNTLKQISVDITRSPNPEAVTIAQNTNISSGANYAQSLSTTFNLLAGDVINCRIVNLWLGVSPNASLALGVSGGIDLNTWFTWRFIPTADTIVESENSVLSCYADNANGGSIYINLALDPASSPITVGWEVLSFEPPTTALNALPALALLEDYVPSDLLTTTRSFFRGTDYYVYAFGPEGVATGPVLTGLTTITTEFMATLGDTVPIQGSSSVSTSLLDSVIDGLVAYFIYGGDTRANSYSLLPVGSIMAPFLSQEDNSATTPSKQLPAPNNFVRLVADIDSAGAPNSLINFQATNPPTITLNPDNSITISGWAYGPWTGTNPPSSSYVASDGIGGVRFTFVGPPPGPPGGSLVFYDNSYCFTATDLTNLQTPRSFTIPADQTRGFVDGNYRCFIDAGNCPTLESAPGSVTYNQATWVAQAKFCPAIAVPFTFTRSAPLTPAQGASLVLLTPAPSAINVVADINNALDPSVNPAVTPLTDVVFQYALITAGTPVVILSINPTTIIPGGIVAGQITGLANQTTYQVRVGVTNNAPVASPVTIFSEWQVVTTLPFAPLVPPTLTSQVWAWPSTFQNVVNYSVNTSACGGVTPYTSVGVTYSFVGPIFPGRGTFLPLTLTSPNVYSGAIPCPDNTPWTLYTSAQVVDSGGLSVSLVPPVLNQAPSAPQALPPIGKVTDILILPGVQYNIFPFVNVTLPPIGELPINYFCSASFKNDFSTLDFPNAEMVPSGTTNPGYTNRFVFKSFPTLPVDKYVFFRTNTFNAIGPQLNPSGVSPTFVAAYGNVGPLLPAPVPTGGGTNTITITLTATDTTPFGANTQVQVKYINTILTTGLINLVETAPGSGIYSGTLSSVGPGAVIPETYDFAFSVIVTNETVTQYLSAQSGGIVLTA